MKDVATALGLVLVIEGLVYALLPNQIRRVMLLASEMAPDTLRVGGLIAAGAGVAVVWIAKSLLAAS